MCRYYISFSGAITRSRKKPSRGTMWEQGMTQDVKIRKMQEALTYHMQLLKVHVTVDRVY